MMCGSCGVDAPSGVVSHDSEVHTSFTCDTCDHESTAVVWMDNSTGYQCQRCDKVFGPWDYGWPPDCCAVDESIYLHPFEA